MSLDMTVGAREASLDSTDEDFEAQAASAARLWLQHLMVAAATALGVIVSSAAGIVLFLR
jgi:hypothetical protein